MQRTRDLLKTYPAGDPHRRRAGQHGRRQPEQRRRSVLHPGSRPATSSAKYSDALLAKMKTIPDVADADTTLRTGKPEVRLEIDRAARRRPRRLACWISSRR